MARIPTINEGLYQRALAAAEKAKKGGKLTLAEELDVRAHKASQGNWVPAAGGTETPFRTRSGRKLLYVYQRSTGHHAYLDVETDLILSNEEAQLALGK